MGVAKWRTMKEISTVPNYYICVALLGQKPLHYRKQYVDLNILLAYYS